MGRFRLAMRACADESLGALARPIEALDRSIPRAASVALAAVIAGGPLAYGTLAQLNQLDTIGRAQAYLAAQIRKGDGKTISAIKTYAYSNFYYLSGAVVYSSKNATLSVDGSRSLYAYYNNKTVETTITVSSLNARALAAELVGSIRQGNLYASGKLMQVLGEVGFGYGTSSTNPVCFMLIGALVGGAEIGMFEADHLIRRDALMHIKRAQEMLDRRWASKQGI